MGIHVVGVAARTAGVMPRPVTEVRSLSMLLKMAFVNVADDATGDRAPRGGYSDAPRQHDSHGMSTDV